MPQAIVFGVSLIVMGGTVACTKAGEEGQGESPTANTEEPSPEARKPDGPLALNDVHVATVPGSVPDSTSLEIGAKARLQKSLDASMVVASKARCLRDERVYVDVGDIEIVEIKNMDDYAVGDEPALKGQLFMEAWSPEATHCQLDFVLRSRVRDGTVPLGTFCWRAATVTPGACDPPLVPTATSGDVMTVNDVTVSGLDDHALWIQVATDLHEDIDDASTFVKAVCPVDGVALVDVRSLQTHAAPFHFVRGESVRRSTKLYAHESFGVGAPLDGCDLVVGRWPDGALDRPVALFRTCWKEGKLTEGSCQTPGTPLPVDAQGGPEALRISSVRISPRPGTKSSVSLDVRVDLTVSTPVNWKWTLDDTTLRCTRDGNSATDEFFLNTAPGARERTFDQVGPYTLAPGETSRVGASATLALPAVPERCEIGFRARDVRTAEQIEVGTFCIQGEKTSPAKCPE